MDAPHVNQPAAHPSQPAATAAPANEPDAAGFFANVLDIINPLQHIPIVSTVYRAITGDEITGPAKLVGGALFGGVFGAAAAAVSVVVEEATGRDVGEHALALFDDDEAPAGPAADQLAARPAPAAPTDPASDPAHIVWNGLRATPNAAPPAPTNTTAAHQPPANPPLLAQSRLEQEAAADLAARIAWQGPRATATPPAENDALPPDWVGQALADAETLSATDQRPAAPKPWIAGAMLEALEKYEALAKSRGDGA